MALLGYARVSTTGQSLDIQLEALELEGCRRIFKEKVSGATTNDREELDALIEFADDGDLVVITKLDRLARSMRDFCNIVEALKNKGCGIRVLATKGLDSDSPTGKLILDILASVAEFERELLRERQRAGIDAAKAKGVYTGRKAKAKELKDKVLAEVAAGGNKTAIAKNNGISRGTLYNMLAENEKAGAEAR
jgi:DNA invertase Pin-like site-specific DNA recombinase